MKKRVQIWPWLMGAGGALALFTLIAGPWRNLPLWVGVLTLLGGACIFCRSETGRWPSAFLKRWWASVAGSISAWLDLLRARWVQWADAAPAYWRGPAVDETQAGYRADYERLMAKRPLSRADLFQLAEVLDGLQAYRDDPLAKPPRIQGFAALGGGGLGQWVWLLAGGAFLTLLAACGVLYGRGEMLKAQRDRACTVMEMEVRTTRQSCRDLAAARDLIFELDGRLDAAATAAANATARANLEAQASRALNQRTAARASASAQRLRRAHEDDLEAARAARAPDWDSRLRDLSEPALIEPLGPAGAAPGADPAGGVPGRGG
jgi:hypothetical protein